MTNTARREEIVDRVKTIMRRDLKLGSDIPIDLNTPFFGGEADIDSLDILLLLTSIEREFGFKIPSEEIGRKVFENLGTLCEYLDHQLNKDQPASASSLLPAHGIDRLGKLPHAPPFRFVSRVIKIVENESAEGIWAVDGSEEFFKGHFPGHPIVPGALLAEVLAQISGIARSGTGVGKLAKFDVRFEESVVPPAEILLTTKVIRSIASLIQYQVEASCNGKKAARGTIALSWSSGTNPPSDQELV